VDHGSLRRRSAGGDWADWGRPPGFHSGLGPSARTRIARAVALITAAYHGDPTKANDRFECFLSKGQEMATGKIPLPEAKAVS